MTYPLQTEFIPLENGGSVISLVGLTLEVRDDVPKGTWHMDAHNTVLLPLLWLCSSEVVPAGRYKIWGKKGQELGFSLLESIDSGISLSLPFITYYCMTYISCRSLKFSHL